MSTPSLDPEHLAHALGQTSFFQGMDLALLRQLASYARWDIVSAGAVLFLEGDPAPGFYFVDYGWIKVVKLSPEGREQVLYFWSAGDLFGGVSAFVNQAAPATAIALETSGLWSLSHEIVQKLLIDEPLFAVRMIEFMAQRLSEMITLVTDLSLRSVTARLARQLLEHADGDVVHRQRWATQSEMAARLGAAPDVVNRALRSLVEEGLIELSRRQIRILDRAQLAEKAIPDR